MEHFSWDSVQLEVMSDLISRKVISGDKAMVAVGIDDPAAALYSATNADKGSTVNQAFLSGVGDIIASRRPVSEFEGLLSTWKSAGGDKIRGEFEQALSASK